MSKAHSDGVNGWHITGREAGGLLELKNFGIVHSGEHSISDVAVHDRVYERGQHKLTIRIKRESTGRKGVATREATPRTCVGMTDAGAPDGGLDQPGTTIYLGDKESIYMSQEGFPARDGKQVDKLNFHSGLVESPDEIVIYGVTPFHPLSCDAESSSVTHASSGDYFRLR